MSPDELRAPLTRHARPGTTTAMSGTVLAIVAEGGKRLALGDRVFAYGVG